MPTVRDLLDEALIRHWSFQERKYPPGAALLFLNARQRRLLLAYARSIEGLVTTSSTVASVITGLLVGSSGGVPVYSTTSVEGWPVLSSGGVPYVDFAGPSMTVDPYGIAGGTPGFPLPTEFIKLVSIGATYQGGSGGPVTIVHDRDQLDSPQGRDPAVFVNGNRLVPVRQTALGGTDAWSTVTAVTLSYIAAQTFVALTDVVKFPAVLSEALVAALAEQLAVSAKPSDVTPAEKRLFIDARKEADAELMAAGDHILGDLVDDTVIYIP